MIGTVCSRNRNARLTDILLVIVTIIHLILNIIFQMRWVLLLMNMNRLFVRQYNKLRQCRLFLKKRLNLIWTIRGEIQVRLFLIIGWDWFIRKPITIAPVFLIYPNDFLEIRIHSKLFTCYEEAQYV